MQNRASSGVLLAGLIVLATVAAAQNLTLSGQVKDQTGQPISGASVMLKQSGKDPRVKETDAAGSYVFDRLAAGAYTLEAGKPGFELLSKTVNVNQDTIENPVLAVGAQSQSVTVEATLGRTTASRMDIPTNDLPVSVSTILPQVLLQQGNNDLPSVLRNAAGVQGFVQYGVYEYYTIRGFNNQDVQLVDGIRQEGNRFNTQLNNIEQVDILRGPGSVLYGPSALGGVINIIRKKPSPFKAYDLLLRGGRFKTYQVGGGLNIPISERLWMRTDMSYFDSEGFRGSGNRRLNVTPAITWLVNDKHRLTFHQSLNRDNFKGDSGMPFGILNLPNAPLDRRYNTPDDFGEVRDSTNQFFYNWTLAPAWEFRNTFSYRWTNDRYLVAEEMGVNAALDVTRTFLYFKHHRRPKFNQVDLTGRVDTGDVTHRVLGGWEYQDYYNFTDRNNSLSIATRPINPFTFAETHVPLNLGAPITRIDYFTNKINAFYGQDHATLFKRLKIQLAGRYDIYRRDVRRDNWANGSFTGVSPLFQKRAQEAFTYRAGVVYDLTEGQNVYFSTAKSFTPVTAVPVDNRELLPEHGRMFEVGHRWNLPGGRGNMYTGLFNIERNSIPLSRPGGLFDQIGQQRSKGLEWELKGNVGKGVFLTANYGYTQAWFSAFDTRTGRIPSFIPKHSAGFWASREWDNGFRVSLGNRYRGRLFADTANLYRLGGWTTWDASAGYRRSRYDWSVNFENLLNRERYFVSAIYDSQLYPGTPFNVTTTLRVRIGGLR